MQTVREPEKIESSPSLLLPTLSQAPKLQTVHEPEMIKSSRSPLISAVSKALVSSDQEKKLKIQEFISWSVCFAVVTGLTGLLKILNVGVTMEVVTSSLFYLSLAGLIYFISKIVSLSKNPFQAKGNVWHDLN